MAGLFGNGGILGNAQDRLDVGKSAEANDADSYRKPVSPDEFDSFGAALVEGKYVEIGRWEAPAGIARRWGYGSAKTEATLGYLYGQFANSDGEQVHVKLQFTWENATGRQTQVVDEHDSQDIDTTDRYNTDEQVAFPEDTGKERADQDEYLVVNAKPITSADDLNNSLEIDLAETDARFPTTEYDVAGSRR